MIHAGFGPPCPHKCEKSHLVTVLPSLCSPRSEENTERTPAIAAWKEKKSLQNYNHMYTMIPSQSSPQHSVTSDLLPPLLMTTGVGRWHFLRSVSRHSVDMLSVFFKTFVAPGQKQWQILKKLPRLPINGQINKWYLDELGGLFR